MSGKQKFTKKKALSVDDDQLDEDCRRPKSTRKKNSQKMNDEQYEFEEQDAADSPKLKKKKQNRQKCLDDISEQEVRRTRRLKKVTLIEESSEQCTSSDEQVDDDSNDEFCWKCKGKGQLICCDYCFRSFHQGCANLKKHPSGQWECPQCTSQACLHCSSCKEECVFEKQKTYDNSEVVCTKCNVHLHVHCVTKQGIPLESIIESPVNKKYFANPQLQQLNQELMRKNDNDEILRGQHRALVLEHLQDGKTLFYVCLECLQSFGIGQIINHVKINKESSVQEVYYLILLESSSYIHSHYLPFGLLNNVNPRKVKNYREKFDVDEDDGLINLQEDEIQEYLVVERLIGCKKVGSWRKMSWIQILEYFEENQEQVKYGYKNNLKFYVKWQRLQYDQCTWEDEFLLQRYRHELKQFFQTKVFEDSVGTAAYEDEKKLHLKITWNPAMSTRDRSQPIWIKGGQLHPFQLVGLEWLKKSWSQSNNVILADEMGLGKTIQTISFLNCLLYEYNQEGPFLIVAPATTLYNWLKEFTIWAEKFNVVVYTGNLESRVIIRQREFFYRSTTEGTQKTCKFNALITSYDTAINDQGQLRKIHWKCLVVDEAHRLKNSESKFFKVSSQFTTDHKILLTGTPLQNNILELINLIEFIAPNKAKQIKNVESLKTLLTTSQQVTQEQLQLTEEDKKKSLSELTKLLQPHILRRTKTDVKLQVPEMEEIIVKLCLTDTQKFLYKNVLLKNYDNLRVLDQKTKNVGRANLLNILMSLRLVCNHPYLFLFKRKFQIDGDPIELINQSNKLKFLDRIIPRLIEMNHKMLVFSQFTMMLDLLQVYFDYRGWSYDRLDGNTGIMDRQKIIDGFNREESKSQIFLLSTRAGGLGINLTSADTIIFTDSDFNPYRDLQAISRAHRMGQVNRVKVYRLVSKYTAEERIIEIATKKLLLEEIIINPINKFTKDDFSQIFKNSTWELFNKNLEERDQEFTEEQLNVLLQRNTQNQTAEQLCIIKNDLNDYYLSGFKFSSCNFEKAIDDKPDEDKEIKQGQMDKYWETLLDGEARMMVEKEYNELGKGKRVKKQQIPNYQEDALCNNPSEYSPSHNNGMSESDQDGNNGNENLGEQLIRFKKDAKTPSERMQKLIEKDQSILKFFQGSVLEHSELKNLNNLSEEEQKDFLVYGMTIHHRIDFLDHMLRFGLEFESLDQWFSHLQWFKPETFKSDYRPQFEDFRRYVKEFYAILLEYEQFLEKRNIVFCDLDPQLIFQRVCGLTFLKRKVIQSSKRPDKFILKHESYQRIKCQKVDNSILHHPTAWTNYDDYLLCKGICEYGYGEWTKIIDDKNLWTIGTETEQIWQFLFKKFCDEVVTISELDQAKEYLLQCVNGRALSLMNMIFDSDEVI